MTLSERQKKRADLYRKLEAMGLSEISSYMLVNNYGYTFKYKGVLYDLRHWLNCYGADVDYWSLYPCNTELDRAKALLIKYDEEV